MDDELIWALVDAAPDALVVITEDGVIELVNTRTEELFGYHRGALLGQPVEMLVPETSRTVHRAHRTRYRVDPVPRAMGAADTSLRGVRSDGTEFPVEISLSPVHLGGSQRIVAAVRDVSNRLESERHSRAIRHAIDTAVDGVFIVDEKSLKFTYVNHIGALMHGYTIDEMLEMSPLHLAPELNERRLGDALEPIATGQLDAVTLRTTALRKDGTEFPVEIHINQPPAPEHDSTARPYVALVRDITERLQDEQELADSRAVTRLSDERERLARDLHDRVIGELFGVGLKMQAVVPVIADDHQAQRLQESVTSIDDVIALIRATIFGLTAPPPTAGVRQHLEQKVAAFHERLGHQPTLTMTGAVEELTNSLIDEVGVVIHEAVTNIAKHANATQTSIAIDADQQLTVTIKDNGTGTDHHTPEPNSGYGLNNLTTRAQTHGGHCTIEPNPSDGTTLTWTVPLL